jgi:uroporphyrin-III C-methyltransferase
MTNNWAHSLGVAGIAFGCGAAAAAYYLGSAQRRSISTPGCFLVGAGPGTVDLLTVRGKELVSTAQVLVCDNLVDESIISLAPHDCEFIDVSKRGGKKDSTPQLDINNILVQKCKGNTRQVVRLKGGDPLIYGRVWPEMEALRSAGCDFQIIPGVTSALAAPAAVGIPLTEKTLSRHFTVVSGHSPADLNWAELGKVDTLVIIM